MSRSKVITAVIRKHTPFYGVMCSPLEIYQRFEGSTAYIFRAEDEPRGVTFQKAPVFSARPFSSQVTFQTTFILFSSKQRSVFVLKSSASPLNRWAKFVLVRTRINSNISKKLLNLSQNSKFISVNTTINSEPPIKIFHISTQ